MVVLKNSCFFNPLEPGFPSRQRGALPVCSAGADSSVEIKSWVTFKPGQSWVMWRRWRGSWVALAQANANASHSSARRSVALHLAPKGCVWGLLHQAAAWPWKPKPWQPAGLLKTRSPSAAMESRRGRIHGNICMQQPLTAHTLVTPALW